MEAELQKLTDEMVDARIEEDRKKASRTIDVDDRAVQEGDTVMLPNFGSFEVKKRLERIMVNPSTGQRMLVPPKLVLNFKPVASIKEKLKSGGQDNG